MTVIQRILPLSVMLGTVVLASCASDQASPPVATCAPAAIASPAPAVPPPPAAVRPPAALDNAPKPNFRAAPSSQKQMIGSVMSVNPDCTSIGYSFVKVVKAPQHGQFTTERGKDFASFPAENIRSACNKKKIPAVILYYKPNAGYTGLDFITIETVNPGGWFSRYEYIVKVI